MTSATDILAIDAHGLCRDFGDVRAVNSVDLAVRGGAVFGLLGPDGAGKSTLLRMLATGLSPGSGDALVFGESVVQAHRLVTPRIGYMSQRFSMYPTPRSPRTSSPSPRTSAGYPPPLAPHARPARCWRIDGPGRVRRPPGRSSSPADMKQKLMLASTLMHEPDLLLLDEPTTASTRSRAASSGA